MTQKNDSTNNFFAGKCKLIWSKIKSNFYAKLFASLLSSLLLASFYIYGEITLVRNLKLDGFEDIKTLEELSNICRNYAIVFFGIFAGFIAIWARSSHEKQIELSRVINRNDRFAKATEMLGKDKSETSQRGGLYTLRDLVREGPETEYIRCVEIIANWLREKSHSLGEDGTLTGSYMDLEPYQRFLGLIQIVADIFRQEKNATLQKNIKEHVKRVYKFYKFPIGCWLNMKLVRLGRVNLEAAYLENVILEKAYLESAILDGAKLNGAYLFKADMKGAFLVNANMSKTNLMGANLTRADLSSAILIGAELGMADLTRANLLFANLKDANLNEANLNGALVSDAKMAGVMGLTKEQILQTTWKNEGGTGKPPELPDSLMQDSDVQEWLKNPSFNYR